MNLRLLKPLTLGCSALLIISLCNAQDWQYRPGPDESVKKPGTFHVYQDSRLDDMVQRHISANTAKGGVNGYRIQIYFGAGRSGRDEANENMLKALTSFPDLRVHIIYQYSNHKVRMGDFRTRNEAYKWFYEVRRKFPNAYIVPDIIEVRNTGQQSGR